MFAFVVFVFIFQLVSEMTYFMSGGMLNLNSVNQSILTSTFFPTYLLS